MKKMIAAVALACGLTFGLPMLAADAAPAGNTVKLAQADVNVRMNRPAVKKRVVIKQSFHGGRRGMMGRHAGMGRRGMMVRRAGMGRPGFTKKVIIKQRGNVVKKKVIIR